MNRLENKVAIITGSGRGIGRAGAVLFAKEKANVVVVDNLKKDANETKKIIKNNGGNAIIIECDVSNSIDVQRMAKIAMETYGHIDILWNNAGVQGKEMLATDLEEEEWERVIRVNLKGVWLCMKYVIPYMIKSGGGSIINTASLCVDEGMAGEAVYSASKGGVMAMSKVLAAENVVNNIRVNWINPGFTRTPMTEHSLKSDPQVVEHIKRVIPMARVAEPEEVANSALFLASDESTYITGTGINVDGGVNGISYMNEFR